MGKEMDKSDENANRKQLKDTWAIRPCQMYKEEYSDCTSFKARFHQYFINGESTDCSQWLTDYRNCVQYTDSNGNDIDAGEAVIQSEAVRRNQRLRAHYANTTWKKRDSPPEDWAKPLPEWLVKKNENTYLELKANEIAGLAPEEVETKSYCSLM